MVAPFSPAAHTRGAAWGAAGEVEGDAGPLKSGAGVAGQVPGRRGVARDDIEPGFEGAGDAAQ
ncbi:MAG TPA: hypothetical protein VLI04_13710, partial [Nocardioidaceae bacterium]|nr:hypothetical protein [Nocardioidaceae bacterium]